MDAINAIDRKIWIIAGPAMLSNISAPLLGLADAAILGHLDSPDYLAAVAVGSAILSFLYWGFGFLRMGTTGLVARALGAGNTAAAHLALGRAAVLALGLALLVLLFYPLWLQLALALMAPAEGVAPLAAEYVGLRALSAPAVLLTYAVIGWCIGRQDTRWPLLIALVTHLLNLLLDLLLILGLGMASAGAALATCCAEYAGALVALLAVRKQLGSRMAPATWQALRVWRDYRPLLRSNTHLFVRTVCLLGSLGFAVLFACARPFLPLLSGLPEVVAQLRACLPWLVLLPLIAAPSYLLDGIFIGAAASRELMLSMLGSVLLVYLPAWWLSRGLGNDGLWLSFLLFSAARSLSLYPLYLRRQRRADWRV
jgi:Na+-driven multidrug efflux pump